MPRSRRGPVVWYLGLIAIIVGTLAISVVLIWIASGQQILVDGFYTSQTDGTTLTEEEYRYWDGIMRNAYQLVTVVAPTLLTGAIVALFTLLAVLAFRWER
ncbi:MAG TPA: hypothetical protein VF479_00745 [Pseudolysinimonas sp.]